MTRAAELRLTRRVLVAAVLVSIVHYADNTVRFAAYEQGKPTIVTQASIPVSWVLFTAAAVAGYVLLRRGVRTAAAALLAVYSASGLVGLLHYTVAPPAAFDWFQNTFIVADVLLGVAVLVVAIRLATTPAPAQPSGDRAVPR